MDQDVSPDAISPQASTAIVAALHEREVTRRQIAQELGISPQAVSRWINRRDPMPLRALQYLAKRLDLSVELLAGPAEVAESRSNLSILQASPSVDDKDIPERAVEAHHGKWQVSPRVMAWLDQQDRLLVLLREQLRLLRADLAGSPDGAAPARPRR